MAESVVGGTLGVSNWVGDGKLETGTADKIDWVFNGLVRTEFRARYNTFLAVL